MDATEHRWVGWRREQVVRMEGGKRLTEDARQRRCACGAEVYAQPSDDLRGTPCTGSDASHARPAFRP